MSKSSRKLQDADPADLADVGKLDVMRQMLWVSSLHKGLSVGFKRIAEAGAL